MFSSKSTLVGIIPIEMQCSCWWMIHCIFPSLHRTLRYVSEGVSDKLIPDGEVSSTLVCLFQALFRADLYRQSDLLHMLPDRTTSLYCSPDIQNCNTDHNVTLQADEIMYTSLGFTIERRLSSLDSAGIGVFVSRGFVPKGGVLSMYPGTVLNVTYDSRLTQGKLLRMQLKYICLLLWCWPH